jgi:hypothetical protein
MIPCNPRKPIKAHKSDKNGDVGEIQGYKQSKVKFY